MASVTENLQNKGNKTAIDLFSGKAKGSETGELKNYLTQVLNVDLQLTSQYFFLDSTGDWRPFGRESVFPGSRSPGAWQHLQWATLLSMSNTFNGKYLY